MRIRQRLSWFATEKGRKFVFASTCFAGCSVFSVNFLPHTFLLEKFKDIVQMYRGGEGVPLADSVLTRTQSVMDEMKLSEKERKLIKFFTVYGFDPYFIGSTATKQGAYIGIPSSYSYKSVNDVDKQQIIVQGKPVIWGSKPSQELLESLVLSENAQKFAIATQIHQALSLHIFFNSTSATVCLLSAYSFAYTANNKLNSFARPLAFRIILYSIIGFFVSGVWALTKDLTTNSLENSADLHVAKLSADLASGGVEFYNQTLRRNIALRELMGESGERQFAASGNLQVLLRTKHMPLTLRRDNVKKIVESSQSQQNVTAR